LISRLARSEQGISDFFLVFFSAVGAPPCQNLDAPPALLKSAGGYWGGRVGKRISEL
jgi:hypothetical protein